MKHKRIKQRPVAGVLGKALTRRSRGQCELCSSKQGVRVYELPPFSPEPDMDRSLMGCEKCRSWLEIGGVIHVESHFLETAIWSDTAAVRLAAARLALKCDESAYPWLRDALEVASIDPASGEYFEC